MAAHIISGVVRDTQGKPIAQARVYFTGAPVSLPDTAALTDDQGAFTLAVPVRGDYTIAAAADDHPTTAVKVSVGDAEAIHLDIQLKSG